MTTWSAFAEDTGYFGDGKQQAMVKYRVDDLDALHTPQSPPASAAWENRAPVLFLSRQAFMTKELAEAFRRAASDDPIVSRIRGNLRRALVA